MTLAIRWTIRASSQLEEAALYLERSRISTNDLQVLSVWHGAREPEGWRTRP